MVRPTSSGIFCDHDKSLSNIAEITVLSLIILSSERRQFRSDLAALMYECKWRKKGLSVWACDVFEKFFLYKPYQCI